MIVADAVRLDCERLRAWCDNYWTYVDVCVELLGVDGESTGYQKSISGVESDSSEYVADTAVDLAEQIAYTIGKRRKWLEIGSRKIRIRD